MNTYGEPWRLKHNRFRRGDETFPEKGDACLLVDADGKAVDISEYEDQYRTDAMDRIVACVNAMQGIEDPAAFVAEAKAREALFRFSRQDWRDVAEQCKETLKKTWDAGIVPIRPDDLTDIWMETEPQPLNPKTAQDKGYAPDYESKGTAFGVCDTPNSRREVFGVAVSDAEQWPLADSPTEYGQPNALPHFGWTDNDKGYPPDFLSDYQSKGTAFGKELP